ncbi:hypothetical protein CBR_g19075 [Chara braunii]|uniref:Uncharacterized protein n=1 Tax=Chara braunii TaxID=69332 RepID=A0A388KXA0_CHABU|nr:hypothetical protein CBR_g19075 [Chara braunii]|eukprot:GBG74667.1 hypothetical protein CBR_g19075 [Chara braunii]
MAGDNDVPAEARLTSHEAAGCRGGEQCVTGRAGGNLQGMMDDENDDVVFVAAKRWSVDMDTKQTERPSLLLQREVQTVRKRGQKKRQCWMEESGSADWDEQCNSPSCGPPMSRRTTDSCVSCEAGAMKSNASCRLTSSENCFGTSFDEATGCSTGSVAGRHCDGGIDNTTSESREWGNCQSESDCSCMAMSPSTASCGKCSGVSMSSQGDRSKARADLSYDKSSNVTSVANSGEHSGPCVEEVTQRRSSRMRKKTMTSQSDGIWYAGELVFERRRAVHKLQTKKKPKQGEHTTLSANRKRATASEPESANQCENKSRIWRNRRCEPSPTPLCNSTVPQSSDSFLESEDDRKDLMELRLRRMTALATVVDNIIRQENVHFFTDRPFQLCL